MKRQADCTPPFDSSFLGARANSRAPLNVAHEDICGLRLGAEPALPFDLVNTCRGHAVTRELSRERQARYLALIGPDLEHIMS